MCGLSGFWDFEKKVKNRNSILQEMISTLYERGPDSHGIQVQDDLCIAHSRLSIVDLTASGHQPMHSLCARYLIAYNGELYNNKELRSQLAANYPWRGSSDTETILELFANCGIENTVEKLIGMFAIVLYDVYEKSLYLITDRLGKKPLYYGYNSGIFFFGSQVKSFLPNPNFNPKICPKATKTYFKYNYIPAPYSIYENIFKLEPGYILKITPNLESKKKCYWSMEQKILQGRQSLLSEQESIERFEEILYDSVKRRLLADVPIGAFLSGGIDSSLIVSIMQKLMNKPVKTFTIGFHEQKYNEANYALKVSHHLQTDHVEEYLPIDNALNIIPEIPKYCDEPFADASQIPTLLVSHIAKQHVTVSLSGDGGDEFFAGYSRYFDVLKAKNILDKIPKNIKKHLIQLYPHIQNQINKMVGPDLAFKLSMAYRCLPYSNVEDIYDALFNFFPNLLQSKEINQIVPLKGLSDIGYMQYHDSIHYLPYDILVKMDRCSMHASLETRAPLLDHRLVELSWQMPDSLKYKNKQPKWLLRQLLYKHVPRNLIERPKMGFSVPICKWIQGPLKDWSFALLDDLKKDGLIPHKPIFKFMEEHQNGIVNWQYSLWGVLMWQHWRNYYKI